MNWNDPWVLYACACILFSLGYVLGSLVTARKYEAIIEGVEDQLEKEDA
jgi:hypothetical protein